MLRQIRRTFKPSHLRHQTCAITLACKPSPRRWRGIIARAGRMCVGRRARESSSPEVSALERSMIGVARNALLALLACLACLGPLAARAPAVIDAAPVTAARIEAVAALHGMVVAQEGRAARIGVDILEQGGNAVDAAVATGFALAVTYPRAGNIGGGGYMLIHFAGGKASTAIDYRETAPAATTRDIFLDERGEANPHKSQDSALAIGVPG